MQIKQALGVVVAILFFLQNIAFALAPESNLWAERRKASLNATTSVVTPPQTGSPDSIPDWVRVAIAPYATIHDVVLSHNPNAKTVFLMQDAHLHFEAQMNIASTLDALARAVEKRNRRLLVGMEGANAGRIDFGTYSRYPNRVLLRQMARGMLKAHILNGVEFAAIGYLGDQKTGSVTLPFDVVGVENERDYLSNVKALTNSVPLKSRAKAALADLKQEIEALKNKHLNTELMQFEANASAYEEGTLNLLAYASYLNSVVPAQTPHFQALMEASRLEKAIDFDRVEREKESFLKKLAQGKALPFPKYPHMDLYVRYVSKTESIDQDELFKELRRLEDKVSSHLTPTREQAEVLSLKRDYHLLTKLVDHLLTEEEWQAHRQRHAALGRLEERLKTLGGTVPPSLAAFKSAWEVYEAFYNSALARNDSMEKNFLSSFGDDGLAVLVAGGFHTLGLTQNFKVKGMNVVVLSPKITQVEEGISSLDLLASGQLPLDQIFAGEKLFLPTPAQATRPDCQAVAVSGARALEVLQAGNSAASLRVGHMRVTAKEGEPTGDELGLALTVRAGQGDPLANPVEEVRVATVEFTGAWHNQPYNLAAAAVARMGRGDRHSADWGKSIDVLTRIFEALINNVPIPMIGLTPGNGNQARQNAGTSRTFRGSTSLPPTTRGTTTLLGGQVVPSLLLNPTGAVSPQAMEQLQNFVRHVSLRGGVPTLNRLFSFIQFENGDPARQQGLVAALQTVLRDEFGLMDFKVIADGDNGFQKIRFDETSANKKFGLGGVEFRVNLKKKDPLATMAQTSKSGNRSGVFTLEVSEEFLDEVKNNIGGREKEFMAHEFVEGVLGNEDKKEEIHNKFDEIGLGPTRKAETKGSIGDRVEQLVLENTALVQVNAIGIFKALQLARKDAEALARRTAAAAKPAPPTPQHITPDIQIASPDGTKTISYNRPTGNTYFRDLNATKKRKELAEQRQKIRKSYGADTPIQLWERKDAAAYMGLEVEIEEAKRQEKWHLRMGGVEPVEFEFIEAANAVRVYDFNGKTRVFVRYPKLDYAQEVTVADPSGTYMAWARPINGVYAEIQIWKTGASESEKKLKHVRRGGGRGTEEPLQHDVKVTGLSAPFGGKMAIATDDGPGKNEHHVRVLDLGTGELTNVSRHPHPMIYLEYGNQSELLVSGRSDRKGGQAAVLDSVKNKFYHVDFERNDILSAHFSPDKNAILFNTEAKPNVWEEWPNPVSGKTTAHSPVLAGVAAISLALLTPEGLLHFRPFVAMVVLTAIAVKMWRQRAPAKKLLKGRFGKKKRVIPTNFSPQEMRLFGVPPGSTPVTGVNGRWNIPRGVLNQA